MSHPRASGGDHTGPRGGGEQPPVGALAFVALLALLWGVNSVGLKLGLQWLPPIALSTIRFMLGLSVVGAWAALRKHPLTVPRPERAWIGALSVLFTVQTIALTVGTHMTSAGHSTVVMSSFPFFTAVFAHFFVSDDRLDAPAVVGSAIAFGGVILTFAGRDIASGASLAGDLIVLASAVMLGLRTVVAKRLMQRTDEVRLLFWMITLSIPPYIVLAISLEAPFAAPINAGAAAAVVYVGLVVAGFCFISWFAMLRRYSPSKLAVLFFLQPLAGIAAGWMLLGEPLTPALLGGAGLVAVGIWIVNRARHKPTFV